MELTENLVDVMHKGLCTDIKGRPEYRDNTVSAIYGYSEGVEHALETLRLKGAYIPEQIDTVDKLEALPDGAVLLDENNNTVWQVNREAEGYRYQTIDGEGVYKAETLITTHRTALKLIATPKGQPIG